MKIERLINAPVSSNCYIISDGSGAIVIDAGTADSRELLNYIQSRDLNINFILLTHEHFDHCAGVNAIRKQTNAPVYCSEKCNELIQHSRGNYSAYWTEGKPFEVAPADKIIEDGEELNWRGHSIYFYLTLGHSLGSTTIRIDNEALFTGDNYVPNIRTYTNLSGGSKEDLRKTLAFYSLFIKYPSMIVYPGHLKPLTISHAHFFESLRGYSEQQMEKVAEQLKIKED